MKVNKSLFQKISKLARLIFSEKEFKKTSLEFQQMLGFVDKLEELDIDGVNALTHIHKTNNIYRDDIAHKTDIKESILNNSPNHNSDYIKVPKIIVKK